MKRPYACEVDLAPGRADTRPRFRFGTKAETLERLRGLIGEIAIPEFFSFEADGWTSHRAEIFRRARLVFGGGKVIVRSSASGEDGSHSSMAGVYTSVAGVDPMDEAAMEKAIGDVIKSYGSAPGNQVIVQSMVCGITVSGVIMTRSITDGAPYYVLDYDDVSGRTDVVTGGVGASKTVYVYRGTDHSAINSPRVAKMIGLAKTLEEACGGAPLDIEFALGANGDTYLFQARRITFGMSWRRDGDGEVERRLLNLKNLVSAKSRPRPGLAGSSTVFGLMPDWNPAELLGDAPGTLAVSLFRRLISADVWRKAREMMGYKRLPDEELMTVLCGRPYIDVRNSLNSLLPAGLDGGLENSLVDACLERLSAHPELHDKLEFEVALTALDFNFEREAAEWYPDVISGGRKGIFRESLRLLTNRALDLGSGGSLSGFIAQSMRLEKLWEKRKGPTSAQTSEPLVSAFELLGECRRLGTLPFSAIARHAFIGEKILRSAAARGAVSAERVTEFKRSVRTVLSGLSADMERLGDGSLSMGEFMRKYGHLRPGAFDITSRRYADMPEMFTDGAGALSMEYNPFTLTQKEAADIGVLLREAGIQSADTHSIFRHAALSIQWREKAKFLFTRNLSAALEIFAAWGARNGLEREDVAFLTDWELEGLAADFSGQAPLIRLKRTIEQRREEADRSKTVKLGYLIRDTNDLYVSPVMRSRPNFVTDSKVIGPAALIERVPEDVRDIEGKIALVANADPGYDWIFTRGIRGLVTKYGGANSHMAIRCVEMNLPAAIGCGEEIFGKLAASGYLELNCAEKTVRPAIHFKA